jgi:enolase
LKIKTIDGYQVFDSRGNPTVEAEVTLDSGIKGQAATPSGASTGRFEALELRDKDPDRFLGKSVFTAAGNIKQYIEPALRGEDVHDQARLDQLMIQLDGTPNKSRLGANAILAVSMALARASAADRQQALFETLTNKKGTLLPLPEIQIIGGGAHAAGQIDIQDFMIVCTSAAGYEQCLEMTFNVYRKCGMLLKERGKLFGVADEGGYWPDFTRNEEAFGLLIESIEQAGYEPGRDIHLSLDIAAGEFYKNGKYNLQLEGQSLTPDQFYELITNWCRKYPVLSIEDPFAEDDTANWKKFTQLYGGRLQVIGDDLFTTNIKRVKEGQKNGWANSVLIKLNQIGTVTETLRCIQQTQSGGWTPVISARSGETEDPFITHLAVAANAGQLKVGSFARSERIAKWNEGIRIKRQLGEQARFIGAEIWPFY